VRRLNRWLSWALNTAALLCWGTLSMGCNVCVEEGDMVEWLRISTEDWEERNTTTGSLNSGVISQCHLLPDDRHWSQSRTASVGNNFVNNGYTHMLACTHTHMHETSHCCISLWLVSLQKLTLTCQSAWQSSLVINII